MRHELDKQSEAITIEWQPFFSQAHTVNKVNCFDTQ